MKKGHSGAPELTRQDWAIRLGIALLGSVIVALLGPFTTYERFEFPGRLLYWGGLIMGLVLPACFIRKVVFSLVPGPEVRIDILAALVIGLTTGPLVWALNAFGMGFDVATPGALVEHVLIAFFLCLVPVATRAYAQLSVRRVAPDLGAIAVEPAFMRRLEPDLRGELRRVSADGHQLVVYTDRGESRLRMRFSDALAEIGDLPGARIHRSHWVSLGSIAELRSKGRRHSVLLAGGAVLPVSPKGAEALRDAGRPLP